MSAGPSGPYLGLGFASIHDAELVRLWSELEARGCSTVFQSLSFLRSLEDHVVRERRGSPLYIAIVDRERRQADMLVPLMLRPSLGARRLDFLDHGVADYHFPLVAPKAANSPVMLTELRRAFSRALPAHDVLVCPKMIGRYKGVPNPLWSPQEMIESGEGSSRLDLTDAAYEDARKNQSIYRNLRRKRNRLAKEDGYRLIRARSTEEVDMIFKAMIRQRHERFEARGILDSLRDPDLFAHYRRLAVEGCPQGSVLLLGIEVERRIIATSYAFCHNDVLTSVLSSMEDGPFARHSPGLVTMLEEIEWAREAGLALYDFGAGSSHYKDQFGGSRRPVMALAHARTPRGVLYLAAWRARLALRLWLTDRPRLHLALRRTKNRLIELLGRGGRDRRNSAGRAVPVAGRYR